MLGKQEKDSEYGKLKTFRQDICGILKDFDPHKEHGPDEILPYRLEECEVTCNRPLIFQTVFVWGITPRGVEDSKYHTYPPYTRQENCIKLQADISSKKSIKH